MRPRKALVALSGGVDSAATVLILKERGYDVTAVTFLLTEGACPETERLADRLGVPLLVEDIREEFGEKIVRPFLDSYLRGETPAPCTRCNPLIKWDTLARVADREGIRRLATGHYVRVGEHNGYHYVFKGSDLAKDQSYYLWDLDQAILSRALTPLGDFTKKQTRELMTLFRFGDLAGKKESMGVCFLGGKGYAGFLRERHPHTADFAGGPVRNELGRLVGTHDGYPFYTPGQKKGIEFFPGEQGYVLSVDPVANELTVGDKRKLTSGKLILTDCRVTDPKEFFSADRLEIKIRGVGLNPEGFCRVRRMRGPEEEPDRNYEARQDRGSMPDLVVEVPSGAYAPAKGQPAVFYIGDRVVGGGYVKEGISPLPGETVVSDRIIP